MRFLLLEIGGFLFVHSVFLHATYSDYIPYTIKESPVSLWFSHEAEIFIAHKRCQALLNFYSFQLSYNSRKGGAREREYKITNGNLYIHEAKTDGSYDESWIATDEEVHWFLSKYLWKLSLNDVII